MKNLMLSTALVAGSAFGAFAQTATSPYMTAAVPDAIYASNFIGMSVYTSDAAYPNTTANGVQNGWNDIGNINDIVLDRVGKVTGVLIDVGGFLGMGAHTVAVNMSSIKMVGDDATPNDPSDFFLVVNSTKAALEAAPEYQRPATMAGAGMNTAGTAMDNTATTTNGALVAGGAAVGTAANTTMNAAGNTVDAAGNAVATTGAAATGAMATNDMANYTEVDTGTMTTEQLTGARVYDGNNDDIGEVSQLILAADGKVDQAVVDVGGFLGMGEKPVALNMSDLKIMKQNDGNTLRVYVNQTKDQLTAMQTYQKQ